MIKHFLSGRFSIEIQCEVVADQTFCRLIDSFKDGCDMEPFAQVRKLTAEKRMHPAFAVSAETQIYLIAGPAEKPGAGLEGNQHIVIFFR